MPHRVINENYGYMSAMMRGHKLQNIYLSRYMLSPVRLSHGWISRKRFKLGLWNFYRTVAPSL